MEESIKSIGQRLKGLREVLNIPAEEIACAKYLSNIISRWKMAQPIPRFIA